MTETYVFNGKQYTKEEVDQVIELAGKVWRKFVEMLPEIIKTIREAVQTIVDWITENQTNDNHNYNRHVPLDTTRLSQVRVPNVKLPRIRNLI